VSKEPDEMPEHARGRAPDREPRHAPDRASGARGPVAPVAPVAIEPSRSPIGSPADEPPVVARLVVEIRSDGRRTIARGALEDVTQGERVAVEARGDSPLSLALGLARAILSMPMLARASARRLLGGLGRGGAGGRSGGSGRGPGQE
jgi:hypothetical protein